MSAYDEIKAGLKREPRSWLVTGAAGFIGSNLLEALLKLGQRVTGLDNLSTGKNSNLEEVKSLVLPKQWENFRFIQGDIVDLEACRAACRGTDFVLHEAALGSVPLSMAEPLRCHESNVTGFLNMLQAAREAGVKRLVYASSSAVYGDDPGMPKVEDKIGQPLSPYAATKAMNELYSSAFARAFGFDSIGLRYFNVFGPRQDPQGAYAAVIPQWIAALIRRSEVYVNGDGETSRDFCFIENVVQANLLAAMTSSSEAVNQVYNIGLGRKTTLNELYQMLNSVLRDQLASASEPKLTYRDFRPGDIRHSLADIGKARRLLGYWRTQSVEQGLELAMNWYLKHLGC